MSDAAPPNAPPAPCVLPPSGQHLATRRRHREVLVVCVLVLLASALLHNRDDGRIDVAGVSRWPLPPTCMSRELLGISCPGCGLTHSFVDLAHGRFTAAIAEHRIGPLLFAIVLLQLPYRAIALSGGLQRHRLLWTTLPRLLSSVLIFLLIANWLVGILLHLPQPN